MKIMILTHYFPPEIGAPQARLSEMARTWTAQGHEVTVLTGFPNHPTGVIPPEYKGKWFQTEQANGYTIHRHWVYATPNKGFLKKIIGHLSLMATLVLFSLFRGKKPDVIIVSSPTFFSVFSAFLMSKLRRVPYVFEVRDIWPGIFVELGVLKNKLVIGVLEFFELFLYRHAKYVVPVTHGFKEDMVKRGVPESKIHVITNGVDLPFFDNASPGELSRSALGIPEDALIALYIGAHGISHGLPTLVQAASKLPDDVFLLFVGEGAVKADLKSQAESLGMKNIKFVPGVPREQVPDYYRLSDVCLVPLKDIEGFKTFIPSKMFEIMACRRPIIGSLKGEAAEILKKSEGALVIAPENEAALIEALRTLKSDPQLRQSMAEKGRAFVEANYSRESLAMNYVAILEGRR